LRVGGEGSYEEHSLKRGVEMRDSSWELVNDSAETVLIRGVLR